jgi:flagellar basal-body rod protein FlgB
MFERLTTGSNFGLLARTLEFTSGRQQIIANNIANWETPGFRPTDVDAQAFQAALADAVEERKSLTENGVTFDELKDIDGGLKVARGEQWEVGPHGLELRPEPVGEGLLYHDGNDRSMERILQSMTENLTMFRFAATMMRRQFQSIENAISERL